MISQSKGSLTDRAGGSLEATAARGEDLGCLVEWRRLNGALLLGTHYAALSCRNVVSL